MENKYKWHDLRENANDLPTDNTKPYLCLIDSFEEGCVYQVLNARSVLFIKDSIVAWREFELFEGRY